MSVNWEFTGSTSQDHFKAAQAVANAMEKMTADQVSRDVLDVAAESLGGNWDANAVESLIANCSFEIDGDRADHERDVCLDCGGSHIEEGTCLSCQLDEWLDTFDEDEYDVPAMRSDVSTNNLEVGDDDAAENYRHENIVRESITNGNYTQAKEQCLRYGLDYEEILRECN
jgi:hypothetical protein